MSINLQIDIWFAHALLSLVYLFPDKVSNTKSAITDYGIPKRRTVDAKTM